MAKKQKIHENMFSIINMVVVQSPSCVWLQDPMDLSVMPGFPVPYQLLKFAQVHVHCVDDAIQPFHLSPPSLTLSLSQHQCLIFSKSASHIMWPKYWSFSFSISPSNEYSGLISFRIHWFDLLAVQETLKSLLQCHSLKASILQC